MLAAAIVVGGPAAAQGDPHLTVEQLLNDGWKVAGYAGQGTMYILFRHDDRPYLVQCSVLYDTTRGARMTERVRTNCYELR
ncbi:hypothetical protein SLNSH_06740 [Alsobacter soli]|uniref:Uncharacterized protein n=2 Tax=Alsobacter soli TaxID=2109933 RepID=A0A2T1HVZ6_9HYPH|nr:hypothetical protein SLNSH_06740 [Alsobacter soli]